MTATHDRFPNVAEDPLVRAIYEALRTLTRPVTAAEFSQILEDRFPEICLCRGEQSARDYLTLLHLSGWATRAARGVDLMIEPNQAAALAAVNRDAFKRHVEAELAIACSRFKPFNSLHEGYAVLLEEVDELWDEVKKKQNGRDYERVYRELVQVAAMATRLAVDVVLASDRGHELREGGA